jgi:hypothetical protein
MTLPEALSLANYWRRNPASLYGIGAMPVDGDAAKADSHYATREELQMLLAQKGRPGEAEKLIKTPKNVKILYNKPC